MLKFRHEFNYGHASNISVYCDHCFTHLIIKKFGCILHKLPQCLCRNLLSCKLLAYGRTLKLHIAIFVPHELVGHLYWNIGIMDTYIGF